MLLALWQWLPDFPVLPHVFNFLNPFFISSPSLVASRLAGLMVAKHAGDFTIWASLRTTVLATLAGTAAGSVLGMVGGLVLSESGFLERVFRPFIVALNAIPRIALIPIIVIIAGPTALSSGIAAFIIVVFLVFYNAFEGGRSVSREMIQNARILGAGRFAIAMRIRFPYVLAWTFMTLPNAISFGLIGAVTSEILTGAPGMGAVLAQAVATADATLTFSVVVVLSVVGVALVMATTLARGRLLYWWDRGEGASTGA